jgi:hypothetical protein
MTILVLITSALVLISKFFDCYTTHVGVTHPSQELNPRARRYMEKYGVKSTIWIVFCVCAIVVIGSTYATIQWYNHLFFTVPLCLINCVLAFTQSAVAHTNATKRLNFFTRFLLERYKNH